MPNYVFITHSETSDYQLRHKILAPELPDNTPITTSLVLVRNLLRDVGLDSANYGKASWNPFGELFGSSAQVLLKPNWVWHKNKLPNETLESVVTDTTLIEAVLYYVMKTQPKEVIIGDAPIQSCNFTKLCAHCGVDKMLARFDQTKCNISVRDLRLAEKPTKYGDMLARHRSIERYQLFDLGEDSWLEPITTDDTKFCVIDYNPDVLKKHHHPGTHHYLIAREAIDADVVISLPKLKTHQLAGITGALKNMVGINGYKEYLPHHRKGGSHVGGDCYEGKCWLRAFVENLMVWRNKSKNEIIRFICSKLGWAVMNFDWLFLGHSKNPEGAWYGNDTVWRMCLDLQRILHYGKSDGTLSDRPQRKVITISDAVVAGDHYGPLAPKPVPLGIITFGTNVAALEWVHCLLMHLDARKIPLVTHAFDKDNWPLADFEPNDIAIHVNGQILSSRDMVTKFSRHFAPAYGWQGHCELQADKG